MNKTQQAARVKSLCEYLAGIGHPISTVQGYEVLARAHGHKNKHVLASATGEKRIDGKAAPADAFPSTIVHEGATVAVRAHNAGPYTYDEMVALDWKFDVVIPFPVDGMDIDAKNDYASKAITGSEGALEDITYTHVPGNLYGADSIALRVGGYVTSPEDWFVEAEAAADGAFYGNLQDLANAIVPGAEVVIQPELPAASYAGTISRVVALAATPGTAPLDLLHQYAATEGANNEQVNKALGQVVFEVWRPIAEGEHELLDAVTLGRLKYAVKLDHRVWSIHSEGGRCLVIRFK